MALFPDHLDDNWRRQVRSRLLGWYRRHQRSLPWREATDPYRIWISEIMLQQTTVAAVIPYYERFLNEFPDVGALAAAEEQQVLRAWEGLGYYSRARNLHKSATVIVDDLDGQFPDTVEELRQLPGIGPYTARAIASLAFDRPVGILEANTQRLYARLIELDDDPKTTESNRLLWKFADWVVSPRSPAAFNQAAMDVGSTVCRPDAPDCLRCPLLRFCGTAQSGRQEEIPVSTKKTALTDVTELAVLLFRQGRWLMRQAATGERWGGLWDFVRFAIDTDQGDALLRQLKSTHTQQQSLFAEPVREKKAAPPDLADEVFRRTGLRAASFSLITEFRHTVTRYRIRLVCVAARSVSGPLRKTCDYRWMTRDEIERLPLSTTARRIANGLASR